MKKILALLLLVAILMLTGCETFRGLGQDLNNAGHWVKKKIE